MKRKLMKFLVAASVVTVFASFASLAASITIDSVDEVNTTTGDVKVSFTATDMAAADQVTALVFTPTAQNSGPVDTNIVYIDQNSNGTFSGKLNFKMKADVVPGTDCTLLMGGTGVATAASKEFKYTDYSSGYNVSGTVSGVTVGNTNFLEQMYGDKVSTYGFTINLKNADRSAILQTAAVTYSNSVFTYTFPEKVKTGNYVVQIYKPGFFIRNFEITVESADLMIADRNLYYGDLNFNLGMDGGDTGAVLSAYGANILLPSASGTAYNAMYDYNGNCAIEGGDTGSAIASYAAKYNVLSYGEKTTVAVATDKVIE